MTAIFQYGAHNTNFPHKSVSIQPILVIKLYFFKYVELIYDTNNQRWETGASSSHLHVFAPSLQHTS